VKEKLKLTINTFITLNHQRNFKLKETTKYQLKV